MVNLVLGTCITLKLHSCAPVAQKLRALGNEHMTNVFLIFMQSVWSDFIISLNIANLPLKYGTSLKNLNTVVEKQKDKKDGFGEHLGNVPKGGCRQKEN